VPNQNDINQSVSVTLRLAKLSKIRTKANAECFQQIIANLKSTGNIKKSRVIKSQK